MTGSGSPGSQTSSIRLASPQTATSTTPSSSSDRAAAATSGAPPATTRRVAAGAREQVRGVREPARPALLRGDPLLVPAVGLVLQVPGEPAANDLGHRR